MECLVIDSWTELIRQKMVLPNASTPRKSDRFRQGYRKPDTWLCYQNLNSNQFQNLVTKAPSEQILRIESASLALAPTIQPFAQTHLV